MTLRGWSWEAATGPARLGDRPLLEALEVAIPDEAVEATIEATGTRERRRRRLPTHLVVTLVVAMGLWASESMRHVLAEVVAGWREGAASERMAWRLPRTAAIVQARQRAGARLFRELFQAVARPIATARTRGAFLGGLRLTAIDGTTVDVADTPENDQAFGRPTTKREDGAFPQIRILALVETGTHVICDAVVRPYRHHQSYRQKVRNSDQGAPCQASVAAITRVASASGDRMVVSPAMSRCQPAGESGSTAAPSVTCGRSSVRSSAIRSRASSHPPA